MKDCIEWEGARTKDGYGRISGSVLAHRRVMADIHGEDAIRGKDVMHVCDNPPCVNPDHLRIGTRADNMQDASRKGRTARGERHGRHRLTASDVWLARRWYQDGVMTGQHIAAYLGISFQHAYAILAGEKWAV